MICIVRSSKPQGYFVDYQNIVWESKQSKKNSSVERIPTEKPKWTTKAKHNLQLYLDQILKIDFH
jgi:hypothetical protein